MFKNLSTHLKQFNFVVQVNSRLSERYFASLFLIDLIISLMLPIDKIFHFSPFNNEESLKTNFNVYLKFFAQLENFNIVTDIINGFLGLYLLTLFLAFIQTQKNSEQNKSLKQLRNKYLNILFIILLILGRFLSHAIVGIQILALRCYFQTSMCTTNMDVARLFTNLLGIFFIVIISYLQYQYQKQQLPEISTPWARTKTKYYLIVRFMHITSVILLVFENFLLQIMSFYIICLPLLALSSIALIIVTRQIVYFSSMIDTVALFKCVIVWNFTFFACGIDILVKISDFTFTILLTSSIFLMGSSCYIYKHQNKYKLEDIRDIKNDTQAQQLILKLFQMIQRREKDKQSIWELQNLYKTHIFSCDIQECLCQKDVQKKLNEKETRIQNIGESSKFNLQKNKILSNGKQMSPSDHRNYSLLIIYFEFLSKITDQSKLINFFEIYIKIIYYNHIYQSMYQLIKRQSSIKDGSDQIVIKFLKSLIHEKAEKQEDKGRDQVNIDQILAIDKMFLTYRKSVYETTLQVERFWSTISKQDYQINQVISIGVKIVEEYLETKRSFEFMIKHKPDFEQAVVIHLKFLDQVMNFELETNLFQSMLTNIRQKLQISKQSHYVNNLEKQALLLVQNSILASPKILYGNETFCKITGYQKEEIQGQHLNMLIPNKIAKCHDDIISDYLMKSSCNKLMQKINRRAWLVKSDGSILPGSLQIQLKVSTNYDLVMQCTFDQRIEVHTSSITYNLQDTFIILADESGILINASENFIRKFLQDDEFFSFEDSRIFIDDVISNVAQFSQIDLLEGKQTNMISNISRSQLKQTAEDFDLLPIMLFMNEYNLPDQLLIKEFIIVPQFDIKNIKKQHHTQSQYQINDQPGSHANLLVDDDINPADFQMFMESMTASMSGSASGSRSSMSETLRQKQEIDEKSIPKSLQNLKKAIIIFFLILIGTSFAVLAVNQIQNTQFKKDSGIVAHSITLSGNMNYLRLCFRMMVSTSKISDKENLLDLDYLQGQMDIYFDRLQQDIIQSFNEENYATQILKDIMQQEIIGLAELQDYRQIITKNLTFPIALQQYMAKAQKFITMNQTQFVEEFLIFRLRELLDKPTINHKDAYYLIINGIYDLRSYALLMSDSYISQSQGKSEEYQYLVLIITMTCISITFISAVGVIPVTFSLDNEAQHIVDQWRHIDSKTKKLTLQNVNDFIKSWNEELAQKDGKQSNTRKMYSDKDLELLNEEIIQNSQGSPYLNIKSYVLRSLKQVTQTQDIEAIAKIAADKLMKYKNNLHSHQIIEESKLDHSSLQLINNSNDQILRSPFQNGRQIIQNNFQQESISQFRINSCSLSDSQPSIIPLDNQGDNKVLKDQGSFPYYYSQDTNQKNVFTNNYAINESYTQSIKDGDQKLNESQSDIEQKELYDFMRQRELISIFRMQKLKKISLIMIFSIVILGFYLTFFFISRQISDASKDSFLFIKNFSRRPTCLANGLNFMLETYAQNKTIRIGFDKQTSFDFLQKSCMNYESVLKNYQQDMPVQLKNIWHQINDVNSDKMCQIVFKEDKQLSNECSTFNNGVLNKGLTNTMLSLYYYIIQEYVAFMSFDDKPYKRDAQFLNPHEFSVQTQNYIYMVLKFVLPSSKYLEDLVSKSLTDYLGYLIEVYIAIFIIFLVFLLSSLVICLRFVIQHLRTVVIRSKILIKIIPSDALKTISREIKDEKEFKRHSQVYSQRQDKSTRKRKLSNTKFD